ncbi:hypothetical protein PA01_16250 [Azoarcus sp. PA01]|nr:hypothetical protein PA01_16250 [Azoarcus sp. PA01]
MIGILNRITRRKHDDNKRSLRENAEKVLKHDQLIARVKSGTEVPPGTADAGARSKEPPSADPVIDVVDSTMPPQPGLPPGFEDELRRLSKLMDFDD